jgi:hypothetical protein
MKYFLLLFSISLVMGFTLAISGCNKYSLPVPNLPMPQKMLIVTNIGSLADTALILYTYDELNRVASITNYRYGHNLQFITNYTYLGSKIIAQGYGKNPDTCYLNEMGLVESDTYYGNKYIYDNSGYLVTILEPTSIGFRAFANVYNAQHEVYLYQYPGTGYLPDTFIYPPQPYIQPYFGNQWQTGKTNGAVFLKHVYSTSRVITYSACAADSLNRLTKWATYQTQGADTLETDVTYYFY